MCVVVVVVEVVEVDSGKKSCVIYLFIFGGHSLWVKKENSPVLVF